MWNLLVPRGRRAGMQELRGGQSDVFRGLAFGMPLALGAWLLILMALVGFL